MMLTEKELGSEAWVKIKTYYLGRKQELMRQLTADMPEDKTAKLRGRIAECNNLLGLESRKETEQTEQTEQTEFDDGF
jgi:hypothetical protein